MNLKLKVSLIQLKTRFIFCWLLMNSFLYNLEKASPGLLNDRRACNPAWYLVKYFVKSRISEKNNFWTFLSFLVSISLDFLGGKNPAQIVQIAFLLSLLEYRLFVLSESFSDFIYFCRLLELVIEFSVVRTSIYLLFMHTTFGFICLLYQLRAVQLN